MSPLLVVNDLISIKFIFTSVSKLNISNSMKQPFFIDKLLSKLSVQRYFASFLLKKFAPLHIFRFFGRVLTLYTFNLRSPVGILYKINSYDHNNNQKKSPYYKLEKSSKVMFYVGHSSSMEKEDTLFIILLFDLQGYVDFFISSRERLSFSSPKYTEVWSE